MTDAEPLTDPELDRVRWDLSDLIDGSGPGDPPAAVEALLDDARHRAGAFVAAYAGRVAELDGPELVSAMSELGEIRRLVERATTYADLSFALDTTDQARGALVQHVHERTTGIDAALLFFRLEWAALDESRAGRLLAAGGLGFARHHLATARRYRPHLLTEPEEKILAAKEPSGPAAWVRLHRQQTAQIAVDLPDVAEPVPLETALARLYRPERDMRRQAAEAVTAALAPGLRTRCYAFNMLLADKATDDRLRHYPHWLASRNLANEASEESVRALIESVRGHFHLPQRWYRLKARILGLEKLADYDRMAPIIHNDSERLPWRQARELVQDSYAGFSGELGAITERFFTEGWIDAPVRPGKRGGAFCSYATPELHPYVLLNYTYQRRDVLTLAHELGHGVHAVLGARQGIFQAATPLTLAETASVFGERLTLERLLARARTPAARLSLLAESVEGAILTIFRQMALNRFEHLVHTHRREHGELTIDVFGDIWATTQHEMLGDAVEITEGYRSWWSYVPHFIATPGYVYAYAYGQLLALAIYQRYQEQGEAFVPAYLDLLRAGGSRSPEELAAIAGIDLTDPAFWDRGLDLVERQIEATEQAALDAGRLSGG